jgi:hypothetical protein
LDVSGFPASPEGRLFLTHLFSGIHARVAFKKTNVSGYFSCLMAQKSITD